MEVKLDLINKGVLLRASNETGNTLKIDGSEAIGGTNGGFRPMQLLLAGIGGCSAMDAITIIRKQKMEIKELSIIVEGTRQEGRPPTVFTNIHLHYILDGIFVIPKLERALELAVKKYCSVGKMLEKSAEVTYSYEIKEHKQKKEKGSK
jgi:putative redox protein